MTTGRDGVRIPERRMSAYSSDDEEHAPSTMRTHPALDQLQGKWTPPIKWLIIIAMLLSSTASIAGGLIMYYESLSSLEETVKEKAAAEVEIVARSIQAIVNGTLVNAEQYINMVYSTNVITSDDEMQWAMVTRMLSFSNMVSSSNLYGLGVFLFPEDDDPSSALYLGTWRSTSRNGSQDIIYGGRHNPTRPPAVDLNGDGKLELTTQAHTLSFDSGAYDRFLYTWNSAVYLGMLRTDNDTRAHSPQGFQLAPGFVPEVSQTKEILGRRHRPAMQWESLDGRVYAYSGWDTIYAPPPAPHPWSKYRAVCLFSLFEYDSWKAPVEEYASRKSREDTTIVVIDIVTRKVFATTESQPTLDQACFDETFGRAVGATNCTLTLDGTSQKVQDAFNALAPDKDNTPFRVISAAGENSFAMIQPIYDNVYIVWVRPTSVVEDKVQAALVLLILFSASVFLFDAVLAAFEIRYVAWPMADVARAITAAGHMDITTADWHITKQAQSAIMIREVHTLLEGMARTTMALNEFRSFLPDAALEVHALHDANLDSSVLPPTGHAAIVFSDIVSSTELWEALPSAMAEALDIHNCVMRGACRRHKGYEVKTIGDAFMTAFATAQDAYNYAMDCQADLVTRPWPPALLKHPAACEVVSASGDVVFSGLRVRMGIHYGPVDVELNPLTYRTDYRGATVNKAARVEGAACHGMAAFTEEVKAQITTNCVVDTLGARALKGIGEVRLFYSMRRSIEGRQDYFKEQIARYESASPTARFGVLPGVWVDEAGSGSQSQSQSQSQADTLSPPAPAPLSATTNPLQPGRRMPPTNRVAMRGALSTHAHLGRRVARANGAVAMVHFEIIRSAKSNVRALMHASTQCVQASLEIGNMTSGKTETVMGSTVVISWGLSSRVTAAPSQCLRYIGFMAKRVPNTVIGAVIGPFLHGNTGNTNRRYHSIFGFGYQYATALPSLCGQYNTDVLVMMRGGLPVELGHTCVPVDVVRAEQEYGPYVVLERPVVQECTGLRLTWDEGVSDVGAEETAAGTLRKAMLAAAQEGLRHSSVGGGDLVVLPVGAVQVPTPAAGGVDHRVGQWLRSPTSTYAGEFGSVGTGMQLEDASLVSTEHAADVVHDPVGPLITSPASSHGHVSLSNTLSNALPEATVVSWA